ncbi:MAG: YeeE/YedE thiosulfate transporter family protein [Proteobacteria bacterium]|nr:YeeE/YedE thiosulfate transporter family protein [Pseudomonadota bacterium]
MDLNQFLLPLIGGAMIGCSASLLLLMNGRIFGISAILGGALLPSKGDTAWRFAALAGFLVSGFLLTVIYPEALAIKTEGTVLRYVAAGLLVGFGTQLGSGCTSGHGVCGISRLSPRSIAATLTFMTAGAATVALMRLFGGAL